MPELTPFRGPAPAEARRGRDAEPAAVAERIVALALAVVVHAELGLLVRPALAAAASARAQTEPVRVPAGAGDARRVPRVDAGRNGHERARVAAHAAAAAADDDASALVDGRSPAAWEPGRRRRSDAVVEPVARDRSALAESAELVVVAPSAARGALASQRRGPRCPLMLALVSPCAYSLPRRYLPSPTSTSDLSMRPARSLHRPLDSRSAVLRLIIQVSDAGYGRLRMAATICVDRSAGLMPRACALRSAPSLEARQAWQAGWRAAAAVTRRR